MSGLFRRQRPIPKSKYRSGAPLWIPDHALPYVIHSSRLEQNRAVPFVCIWPEILRLREGDAEREYCFYMLNREHIFLGKLLEKTETEAIFEDLDGHFDHDTVRIAVITDREFAIVQEYYQQNGWAPLRTKEDLTQNFIECFDD